MLKKTDIDGIIFEGCASEPVYLYVTEEKAELRPASHLWGKDTHQTTDLLKKETDKRAKIACIGPAGEKGVLLPVS